MLSRVKGAFAREPRLKPFAFGLGAFAVTVGIVCWIASTVPLSDADSRDNFWISLSASFVEDLVFFLFIGGIGVYISLTRPGDEVIDSRIKYLFNASSVSESLHKHLTARIKPLGIFSDHYKTTITYTEYNKALDAAKAVVEVERRLVNMFRDVPHRSEPQRVSILTDKVGTETTEQGQFLDCCIVEPNRTRRLLKAPVSVLPSGLQEQYHIDVPSDGWVTFTYRFWVWHKNKQEYSLEVLRFSETVEVLVVNAMDRAVTLLESDKGERRPLTPEGEHRYLKGELATGPMALFALEIENAQD